MTSRTFAHQLNYWTRQLDGVPPLSLATDRPRPAALRGAQASHTFSVPAQDYAAFLAATGGAEEAAASLAAAYALLLSRFAGSDDVAFGVPHEGDVLVLRAEPGAAHRFSALATQLRGAWAVAREHAMPAAALADALCPEKSTAFHPLYQSLFCLNVEGAFEGLDVSMALRESHGGLEGKLYYAEELFDAATLARLADSFCELLRSIASAPAGSPLDTLSMLTAADAALQAQWNDNASPYPDCCIHDLFEAQAAATPLAIAVRCGDTAWTYDELNRRANRIAHSLLARGLRPDGLVGVCMERSALMVAGLLGILKAGGAYVALDPSYPPARLQGILEDSAVATVLTGAALPSALQLPPQLALYLDRGEDFAVFSDANPSRDSTGVTPEHLAYLIYTSGSTGLPKGVAIRHRNTVAMLQWARDSFSGAELRSVLASTSLNFDLSVFELFVPLSFGHCCVVVPDALALLDQQPDVSLINTVPSAIKVLLERDAIPASAVAINLAGEPLAARLVNGLLAQNPLRPVYNLYGPSEDTTYSTWARFDSPLDTVPDIGRGISNTRLYVLSGSGCMLPVGAVGELYIGGAGVARGYLNRPELTAERFLDDPFCGAPGKRMYRTGDIVRWLPGGRMAFLGRADHQVKIRGFRIELGEIENLLASHPSVREALVMAREDQPGDKRLAAYVTGHGGEAPDAAALTAHLKAALPDYMVPSAFVILEAFPLTPNGKMDRKALPAPDYLAAAAEYIAPRTPTETVLADAVAEVLGLERAGMAHSFFELGGHSLLATQLISRLRNKLSVELSLAQLFATPILGDLAAAIGKLSGGAVHEPIPAAPRGQQLPASFAQERLWFLDQLEGSAHAANYLIPMALRLNGTLDANCLRRALQAIVDRHESLRTAIVSHEGRPVQHIVAKAMLPWQEADLRGRPEQNLREHLIAHAGEAFHLNHAPLVRAALFRTADDEHMLSVAMHHIASDGWSLSVLAKELGALYEAFAAGRPDPLSALAVQYVDYALWQREPQQGEMLQRQLDYWAGQLEGLPPLLTLPTDHPRPPVRSYRGGYHCFTLPACLTADLKELGQRHGATLFMTLSAAFSLLLSRHSGQDDIAFGTPIANRNRHELEDLIGFFANTLVIRSDLSRATTFSELLEQSKQTCLAAYDNQDLPFEQLVSALNPERSTAYSPLFQVMLVLQNAEAALPRMPGLEADMQNVGAWLGSAKFDLTLTLEEREGALDAFFNFSTDLFEASTIGLMAERFTTLLADIVRQPSAPLSRLRMLPDAERALIDSFNRHTSVSADAECMHHMFERQADLAPDSIAVSDDTQSLSYAALDSAANRIAHALIASGIEPGMLVGIRARRSVQVAAAMLGVLKAGAAYLPLDPSIPEERLRFILGDADARMLVTESALLDGPSPSAVLLLDGAELANYPSTRPSVGTDPTALAYVIYTSGSTGLPKGVMIEHRHVARLFGATRHWFGFDASDVWSVFHAFAFDFSVWELWGALLHGGRAVIVPYETSRSPSAFLELLEREQVTMLSQTPSAFGQLLNAMQEAPQHGLGTLRHVVFGGEALDMRSLAPWFARFGQQDERLVNMYGITETTVHVSYRRLRHSDLAAGASVIGVAIPDLQLHLLDETGQPVPVGVTGEIHVGGAGVGRGYLNRPELTAERFIPDPYAATPGARLYCSGDLARWTRHGELEYLGRKDFQVKIRGFRIELGEIENRLAALPSVRGALVMAREDQPGDKRLVAYVAGDAEASELRARLKETLPEYMVPSAIVVMESFPLTGNGKIDRKALPAPEMQAAEGDYLAPRTATEAALAEAVMDVLRIPRAGMNHSFFELGGHSLLATQLVSRLRSALGVELGLAQLFATPVLGELAAAIDAKDSGNGQSAIACVPRSGPLPASFAQERLWFIDQLEGGASAASYLIPMALRLRGRLDVQALHRALQAIVDRHESLRTAITGIDGHAMQEIAPEQAIPLPLADLGMLPSGEREAALQRKLLAEALEGFDLGQAPLLRTVLFRLAPEEHVLAITMHHIVSDGWSIAVLTEELNALYAAFVGGRANPLPPLPIQYADYAAWQRSAEQGTVLERQLDYWTGQLAGLPPLLALPTDRPRPPVRSHQGAYYSFTLPATLTAKLNALGQRHGATLFMTLSAAFSLLLARHSGQDDVAFGTPIANRNRHEVEKLIGFFANTLVIRSTLPQGVSFAELLERMRRTCLAAYENQDLPFEQLVSALNPERSTAYSPLFQVMFSLHNNSAAEVSLPALTEEALGTVAPYTAVKFDLELGMTEKDGGLFAEVMYNVALFDGNTIERMMERLSVLLHDIVERPDIPAQTLAMTSAAEWSLMLEHFNSTTVAFPEHGCVHEMVEAQARRTPHAIAAQIGSATLSYGELDRQANRLAHCLQAQGVGPDVLVGLCAERSLEMIVGMLAVLKAGGAYVPVDPAYPAERIAYMIDHARAPVLLAQRHLLPVLPATGATVLPLGLGESLQEWPDTPPACAADRSNLAYVIYTSGSTGLPKGVMIEHAALMNLLLWKQDTYRFTSEDRVLQKTSFAFDGSVWEFWTPLLCGARIVFAQPGEHLDPAGLVRTMREQGITAAKFVPSLLALVCEEAGFAECQSLRHLFCGGEALPSQLVQRCHALLPQLRVHNLYGPTECTVDATAWTCQPGHESETVVLGPPIANTRIYILDPEGAPAPLGVAGELHIGGVQVARGYLHRPELTAEKFVADPFIGVPGARMYRTGDLARWLPDGNVEFLGRMDHQVKLRGFRIELGEIENCLASHPSVREVLVMAREDRLVAYVTGDVDGAILKAHLQATLPDYMIPSAFVVLDAFPLSPNGKADRKALPAPDMQPGAAQYIAPRTLTEQVVADTVAAVLKCGQPGMGDSFFDLGGHSLLATQLVSRLRRSLGAELNLAQLFATPVLGDLARAIDASQGGEALAPIPPAPRDQLLPASFAQERLWFLDQLEGGTSANYLIPMAVRLCGELNVPALQRAMQAIVNRHEALRTAVTGSDGCAVQEIAGEVQFELPLHDLGALPDGERASILSGILREQASLPIDLRKAPLMRGCLLRIAADEHVLSLTLHHIVGDGWSMDLLRAELSALYSAFAVGSADPLPPLPIQYADYAAWQRGPGHAGMLASQLEYWSGKLAGLPALLALPTDRPRPAVQRYECAGLSFHVPADVAAGLKALSQRNGTTLFMTLSAAFSLLLGRYSGQTDIAFGTPIANRSRQELEQLIGFFVNTLVIRTDLDATSTVGELLAQTRRTCLEAYGNQDLPFEQLVSAINPERSTSYTPLFQVLFVLQNMREGSLALPGLEIQPCDTEGLAEVAKFDLSLAMEEGPAALSGRFVYSTSLFDTATIERLTDSFGELLRSLAGAQAGTRLDDLSMLTSADAALQARWNDTAASYPDCCIPELIEAQVRRTPDAIAAQIGEATLSYAELNLQANRLAHHLQARGVGPDVLVAVCAERSLEMIVALLAVLKAGGAYVPIDPAYPAERIAFLLADTRAVLLLTQQALLPALPAPPCPALCLDTDAAAWADASGHDPAPAAGPSNLAYVIYTSGSTGTPKGVMVEHRSLRNFLLWKQDYLQLEADDRILQKTAFAFDGGLWEFWSPLLCGARLVFARPGGHADPAYLVEAIAEHQITTVKFIPTMLALICEEPGLARCTSLRHVICGGEALSEEVARSFFRRMPHLPLHNLFGPTETTIDVTAWTARADDAPGRIPIGRPIANTRAYVLDRQGGLAPVGVPGELYIGGIQVARGYLNQPALTDEKFLPDPFDSTPGARMYRTGDLARWLPDGAIDYMGRSDFQVKIRGFRIELGEIESRLASHPSVREALVMAREDQPGVQRLVAYVTVRAGEAPDAALLRAHLQETLPEYMVPSAFMVLDVFPLTPNGKIDRKALPMPDYLATAAEYIAPRTSTEAVLADTVADVLGLEHPSMAQSFFELGGHSLLATRLVSRLRRSLDVELSLAQIFATPILSELAAAIDGLSGGTGHDPIPAAPRGQPLPASFAQERLWFLDQFERASGGDAAGSYLIPMALRLQGQLNAACLHAALQAVVDRHESLRTAIVSIEGQAMQDIAPACTLQLPLTDLSGLPPAERRAALQRHLLAEAGDGFDLRTSPLLRASLLRLADDDHVLAITTHHIVSDGWSMGVLTAELNALYAAFLEGRADPLPPLPVQYADYAVWQRGAAQSAALERQLAYWSKQLDGLPPLLMLPTDRPRPPVRTHAGAYHSITLPSALAERLHALGQRHGATLFMTLSAAFSLLLSRHSGQDDIAFGTPIANRSRQELEGLIGFFANTLVIRSDLSRASTFSELLEQSKQTCLAAYDNQDLPFEQLVSALNPERSTAYSPLFQVMFVLQNNAASEFALPGLKVSRAESEAAEAVAKFDLTLSMAEGEDGLHARFNYNIGLFDAATIERMAQRFALLLDTLASEPERPLASIGMLNEAERVQLLEQFGRGPAAAVADCLHRQFEQQALRRPDALALQAGAESLSYDGLNRRANQLAHYLRELGAAPGVLVGIHAERSIDMVIAVLAVLKAGAAYVPLDPAHPADRIAAILDDANAPLVLAQQPLAAATGARIVALDRHDAWSSQPDSNPDCGVTGADLAYAIYTSGSTGKPKGVLNHHLGLANVTASLNAAYGIGQHSRLLQFMAFGFDVCVSEIAMALSSGASLHIEPRETLMGEALPATLAQHRITHLCIPSSVLPSIPLDADLGQLAIITGGDVLPATLARHWAARCRLFNSYGPTETTICATVFDCAQPFEGSVPIGRPLANVQLYILDAGGNPVPQGVVGELHIGGIQVSRGYLNRPEMTAEKFVADPFSEPEALMYRTGDLARWLPDGNVEFIGRADFQVKVRGFRIELGEIESRLAAHPAVREVLVMVREDLPGDKRIVAYVAGEVLAGELRATLKASLPDYMVPSAFVMLDAFPLTPNGKVDRKALPAPEYQGDGSRYVAPQTAAEHALADAVIAVLKVERAGMAHSFFDLGGHSLLATQLVSRLRSRLGVEISLAQVFATPVLGELAAAIGKLSGGTSHDPIPAAPRGQPLPASFAQERLWFLDQFERASGGDAAGSYLIPMALRLQGQLNAACLHAALQAVVDRHESLRTAIVSIEGQAMQDIAPACTLQLPLTDLSGLPPAERRAALQRHLLAEAGDGFDLRTSPLLRASLLRLADDDHVLAITTHHIVSDGWSMGVLTAELNALYAAFLEGRADPLPPLPVQYADYAVWQRGAAQSAALERQLAYWSKQLDGLPPLLMLPTDRPRPPVRTHAGAYHSITLPSALAERLHALGQRHGATLFMTLSAAFSLLLSRHSGQDDIAFGTPIANRSRQELEGLIGFFANTLVIRSDLSRASTFSELLEQSKQTCLAAYDNQDLPFEQLVSALNPERSTAYSPLFQVMFVLQNNAASEFALPGLKVSRAESEAAEAVAKFDLTLSMAEGEDGLHARFNYNIGLFDAATIERMAQRFALLLDTLASEPERPLASIGMLNEAERVQLLEQFGRGPAAAVADCLHRQFEQQALRRPDALALQAGAESLSYDGLNRRANQLAHYLRELGAAPGVLVGIHAERSIDMVIAVLAVLKAGAAYVPLDPAHPADRIAAILDDANAPLVLAQQPLAAATRARIVALDRHDAWSSQPDSNPDCGVTGADLAYAIYTSGSTGKPKGVLNHHLGLANVTASLNAAYGIGQHSRLLQFMAFGFDVCVSEIAMALSSGASLHIEPRETLMGEALPATLAQHRITHLCIPSSVLPSIPLDADLGQLAIITGGDVLPATLARHWAARCRLFNSYGPTETTICATVFDCAQPFEGSVPIGRPLANVQLYILDAGGNPVPQGVVGELHIGGIQVSRGYLNRPEMTAEKFVADPFSEPEALMYRTGDLARWLPDGNVEFIGRADFQVKVRGFRIELGEIESRLAAHPAVREVLVMVREDLPGDKRIVAYVAGEVLAGELRATLKASLPDYMVPSAFVMLDAFPLTPNGKVDRKALPAPEYQGSGSRYVAPSTPTETRLASTVATLLGVQQVGMEDSFFDLGGHSLLATQLLSRIRQTFAVELGLGQIFAAPAIGELAAQIDRRIAATQQTAARSMADIQQQVAGMTKEQILEMLKKKRGSASH
ncbi:non-ribosomal peptide synthetase [Massilia endophytica]|uniref:non-ribosomal peptide synthetase n=1 Tax=Massilia endophytica TaxID=2899220 RepID=UPI001E595725|nr:non-ribosomal peptide synthase/polyketide synthase [Massilia endophytica]UGQ48691.1 non-ribosomal peptide synthase/polyketide synthase [Massilia endophytica]